MLSWSAKRKLRYFFGVFIVLTAIVSVPFYFYLNQPPTCTDGKQNGDELGVDCGGVCQEFCPEQMRDPIVHWSRSFEIEDGVYDAVALIENKNKNAGLHELIYKFKLYDENNILVKEKFGKTFLNADEQIVVFESGIKTEERIPKRTFIELLDDYTWVKQNINPSEIPKINIRNQSIEKLNTKPRLHALAVNDTPFPARNVYVSAVLFDIDENAIGVSSTIIDEIPAYESVDVTFTWKAPFSVTPVKIEILPRLNLFDY